MSGGQETEEASSEPADAKEESKSASKAPVSQNTTELEERVPMKGIRKAIAKAMVNSKHTAPHVTHMDEIDVTNLVANRKNSSRLLQIKEQNLRICHMSLKHLLLL